MAIVQYSPYTDAANLGEGVGSSLASFAMQLPQIRAQQLFLKSALSKLPYEKALLAAQAAAETARASELGSQGGYYNAQTGAVKAETEGRASLAPYINQKIPGAGGLATFGSPNQVADAIGMLASLAQGGATAPVTIPQGGSAFIPGRAPGEQLITGAATVPPQSQRFAAGFGNQTAMIGNNPNVRPGAASNATDRLIQIMTGENMRNGMPAEQAYTEAVRAVQGGQQQPGQGVIKYTGPGSIRAALGGGQPGVEPPPPQEEHGQLPRGSGGAQRRPNFQLNTSGPAPAPPSPWGLSPYINVGKVIGQAAELPIKIPLEVLQWLRQLFPQNAENPDATR